MSAELSPLVSSLFPSGVVAAELHGAASVMDLHPDERFDCTTFAERRANEYAAGRLCARRALREFGFGNVPLRRDRDRRPIWPDAMVGSISHTYGYCGAVVASATGFDSVGFDAEVTGRVTEDVWPQLFTRAEIARLRALPERLRPAGATLCHSAKEAYYKCQFGVTRSWLDFTDVEIDFDAELPERGTFEVRPPRRLLSLFGVAQSGTYARADAITLTGIAFPQR